MGRAGVPLRSVLRSRDVESAGYEFPPRLGQDTDRPVLDLLPDKFLDLGQVGLGFEVTPVSLAGWMLHRFVLSTGKW